MNIWRESRTNVLGCPTDSTCDAMSYLTYMLPSACCRHFHIHIADHFLRMCLLGVIALSGQVSADVSLLPETPHSEINDAHASFSYLFRVERDLGLQRFFEEAGARRIHLQQMTGQWVRVMGTIDATYSERLDAQVMQLAYQYPDVLVERDRVLTVASGDVFSVEENRWHVDRIEIDAFPELVQDEIRIGIVDTGLIRSHQALEAHDIAGYDFVSELDRGGDGDGRDSDYTDVGDGGLCHGLRRTSTWHGTHVAGLIGAQYINEETMEGLNQNAKIISARAVGRCGGRSSDIFEAAMWLAGYSIEGVPDLPEHQRPHVINLSLSGQGDCSLYEQESINKITETGIPIVIAAGNHGLDSLGTPANCRGVIAVGATNPDGRIANYSNIGDGLDVLAPGGIPGYGLVSTVGPRQNSYGMRYGTSMAAPLVATTVAGLIQLDVGFETKSIKLLLNSLPTCESCMHFPVLDLAQLHDRLETQGLLNGDQRVEDVKGFEEEVIDETPAGCTTSVAPTGLPIFMLGLFLIIRRQDWRSPRSSNN